MLDDLFKISVGDFAKKAKLSVDVVLGLCKKLNIDVYKETDFLSRDDIKLLCDTFNKIFPDINVFLSDNTFLNSSPINSVDVSSGSGYVDYSSVKSNNNRNSLSTNASLERNNENNITSSNNNQSVDSPSRNDSNESISSGEISDDNVDINIDSLYEGADLVNKLKNKLVALETFISGISVIPPLDASALTACKTKISDNIEIISGTIGRINEIKELFPVLDQTTSESFNTGDLTSRWSGNRLTATMGFNPNGPSGTETWYDLNMAGVVHNMEKVYGYSNVEYSVREDGVKLLSGVTPDGQVFKNLVIVAAHVNHPNYPTGNFQRGQIVETSLGMGIVADQCGRSVTEWEERGNIHFDLATSWWTGKYMTNAYNEVYPIEYAEQIVPGQAEPIILKFGVTDGKYSIDYYSSDSVLALGDKDATSFEENENRDNDRLGETDKQQNTENSNNTNGEVGNFVSVNIQPKNNSDIAHRGYHPGGIYENSSEAYRTAGENGFWGCEADVRFDSNGTLVCSHNRVKEGENPPSFEEYLDICKEYGMTAVIDLKYEKGVGPADPNLSPAILDVIKEKGMMDSCVLQTNNYTDIPYIREHSDTARIWYLTDHINESNLNLIHENNVECVNIWLYGENDYYGDINKLNGSGIDVCVWGVQSEQTKANLLNHGATYVMSDNSLGISPYQEGESDFNNIAC